jgi:succinate-semialdehyde dehydrogenase/glutarate-semialdehyde dehydrogenase
MLIDGNWVNARSGARMTVENPATEEAIAFVPDAEVDDADAAIDAACRRQTAFAATNPRDRSDILRTGFELMVERADDLALLMTLENGKPIAESRGEILFAAEFLRWFAEEAVRISGRFMRAPMGDSRFLITRQPVGPALLITPWNFPAAMVTRKVGPAIAAGCTSVLKPAPETPLSALAIASILQEAGLPDGALNVVTTSRADSVVRHLMRDPRLRKISFTGSTSTGRLLLEQAAPHVLRTSMELGGNAPFLVFADADLDVAVEGAMAAKMRSGGQMCTAANRFYVAADLANEFAGRLGERMAALPIGPGQDPANRVGPLINQAGRAKVERIVAGIIDRGARVVVGGDRPQGLGYFYRPTVLAGVPYDTPALSEEIFGPVAPVVSFDSEEDAIAWANRTVFGLIAFVYTRDIGRAMRVTEALETGMVGLNTGLVANPAAPFGGIKESGLGREGGAEGIDEYLETKYISINW